jgi:hypothetical protein
MPTLARVRLPHSSRTSNGTLGAKPAIWRENIFFACPAGLAFGQPGSANTEPWKSKPVIIFHLDTKNDLLDNWPLGRVYQRMVELTYGPAQP